jgi:hypothetical protein
MFMLRIDKFPMFFYNQAHNKSNAASKENKGKRHRQHLGLVCRESPNPQFTGADIWVPLLGMEQSKYEHGVGMENQVS